MLMSEFPRFLITKLFHMNAGIERYRLLFFSDSFNPKIIFFAKENREDRLRDFFLFYTCVGISLYKLYTLACGKLAHRYKLEVMLYKIRYDLL